MRNFYTLQILIILFGAVIPIINVMSPNDRGELNVRIASAILGGAVVVTIGVLQLTKLRETGIVFRIISAKLQKEYHSFLLRADNYSKYDNDLIRKNEFVKNIESLILGATSEYYDLFRQGPTTETERKTEAGKPASGQQSSSTGTQPTDRSNP
jgi:hypothetical protein